MEIRIKEISGQTIIKYAVQVKRFLFWKTLATYVDENVAISEANKLKTIKLYNETKQEKIEYEMWAVRDKYSDCYSENVSMYHEYPECCVHGKKDTTMTGYVTWRSDNREKLTLRTKSLFNSKCYEPMKVKVTIEKI